MSSLLLAPCPVCNSQVYVVTVPDFSGGHSDSLILSLYLVQFPLKLETPREKQTFLEGLWKPKNTWDLEITSKQSSKGKPCGFVCHL